jgi:predicted patatin/cPLA2 family phospholipase
VSLQQTIARDHVQGARGDEHPIVGLMLARASDGSRRGERTDGARIALAIEGGGSCGVVSGGMCLLLEKTGLIDAVDLIYGTSSGALNGSFTASGQAALGATNYMDVTSPQFANPLRVLTGRSVIDFAFLFDDLISTRKPYDMSGFAAGPDFRALCVDLGTSAVLVLRDFRDAQDLTAAVRASCSLPLLADPAESFRDIPVADGSLIESIPYATALRADATHVLVLRSRSAEHRQEQYPRALIELARRAAHPAVAQLLQERPARYNTEAEHMASLRNGDPRLLQIAPPTGTRVSNIERSGNAIRLGLAAGVRAAADTFGLAPIEVLWQPELYGTG